MEIKAAIQLHKENPEAIPTIHELIVRFLYLQQQKTLLFFLKRVLQKIQVKHLI